MNYDPDTFVIDNDPAALLPFSKHLQPEDPEAVMLPYMHQPSDPRLFGENYS
jgi:hypothetical protein